MSFALWALVIGALLVTMALAGSMLKRLPASASMFYLAVGYGLGSADWGPTPPDPQSYAAILERVSEVALLISLFSVGLKLGLPLSNRQWYLPLRLAFVSMALTVALIAASGVFFLALPLGAAILLGGILAPTDPVLASDVQVDDPGDRDRLRFSLSGEGGLNDGAAFPFVFLGLGLLGLHDLGPGGWRWLTLDLLWALAGGLAIGSLLGAIIGKLVVYLRTHHQEAVGLDEFLAMGLVALAYGAAQLAYASGFLAVFAAGLALQRSKGKSRGVQVPAPVVLQGKEASLAIATDPELAGAYMMQAVRGFNEQMERIAELVIVLVVGAMLPFIRFDWTTVGFLFLLFLVLRPVSVWLGLLGATVSRDQRLLISWFGIRGIGSIYYLMFALHHGLSGPIAEQAISLTLATVAVSIVVHGISVTPLMNLYTRRQLRKSQLPATVNRRQEPRE
ncbi:sodium:proton antiporter [Dechloromonas denitrificans]|uniref:Sodium:proton antiporter n=1 Tax=Dechloromonas denitrificans TaxID=281362 RepID=A0A133XI82_9RHOO|nr:sodium:proton antiporter [Dechloromonas denitrificans]KXB30654.1 sodium:proton antiporter [Dechloromonas denitrificans]